MVRSKKEQKRLDMERVVHHYLAFTGEPETSLETLQTELDLPEKKVRSAISRLRKKGESIAEVHQQGGLHYRLGKKKEERVP